MKYRILLMCILIFESSVIGQIVGNPVGTKGTKQWSVSVNGSYTVQDYLSNTRTVSRRLLLKSEWGITPWFDIYIQGGIHDLEHDFSKEEFTDFKSKMRFCYGIGFDGAYQPRPDIPIGVWTGIQMFMGPVKGEYFENISFAGTNIVQKYKLEYNWMEYKGFLGLIYYGKFFKMYIAQTGWVFQNTSTLMQYSKSGTTWDLEATREGEDISNIWWGGMLGLELDFPGNYALTFECMVFNEFDYQIMIGFSQTGSPGW